MNPQHYNAVKEILDNELDYDVEDVDQKFDVSEKENDYSVFTDGEVFITLSEDLIIMKDDEVIAMTGIPSVNFKYYLKWFLQTNLDAVPI